METFTNFLETETRRSKTRRETVSRPIVGLHRWVAGCQGSKFEHHPGHVVCYW